MLGAATKQAFTTAGDKPNPPITISPFTTKARDYSVNPYRYGEDNSNMGLGYAKGGEVKSFADGGFANPTYQPPTFANATG